MQAAVNRLATRPGRQPAGKSRVTALLSGVEDTGLLNALPIAAAIVERDCERALVITAHNSRFFDTVRQSSCVSKDWTEADCLKSGPIAELILVPRADDVDGELDFQGVAKAFTPRYSASSWRPCHGTARGAPLPDSLFDRTVEVQVGKRALRAKCSWTGLNRPAIGLSFTENQSSMPESKVARDLEHAFWWSAAALFADQRSHGKPCRRRSF